MKSGEPFMPCEEFCSWVRLGAPVLPAFRRMRKEALGFQVSLGFVAKPCLQAQNKPSETQRKPEAVNPREKKSQV